MNFNTMGNPFEVILNRLDQLEYAINEFHSKRDESNHKMASKEAKDKEGGMQLAIEITGLKRGSIYNYVTKRMIPHTKVGGRLRFERERLLKWNQERTKNRNLKFSE